MNTHTIYRVKRESDGKYLARHTSGYYCWTTDRDAALTYRAFGWARRTAGRRRATVEVSTTATQQEETT